MKVIFNNNKPVDSKGLWLVYEDRLDDENFSEEIKSWCKAANFTGKAEQFLLVPDEKCGVKGALFGMGKIDEKNPYAPFVLRKLANLLPEGSWYFHSKLTAPFLQLLSLAAAGYKFDRYLETCNKTIEIIVPEDISLEKLNLYHNITCDSRDLVNIPSYDLGPAGLEKSVRSLLAEYNGKLEVIKGEELLSKNFPLIYAVGKSGNLHEEPRLIDYIWGDENAPKVTLVGKGVCFDSGGLGIKPSGAMVGMKKDMGGAANVIALARLIMSFNLPVRLRVLLPVVENLISHEAFRPGDIFTSRMGKTVEIGHTDAEGRLILADALTYADEENPEILLDMATLTGAARVATGPDLPPFFTNSDDFAKNIEGESTALVDPMWRFPLWAPYNKNLKSPIADLNNVTTDGFAGSITAALFLQNFVQNAKIWAHFDIYAGASSQNSDLPFGNEVQTVRAIFATLKKYFS
ncbi:M17 family metallopeptidase [Bartonella sp. DGB1]|uniref:leucyl aminopeptidase family protein n=1 Tax=Bartonella sp. DGB1 TaxID=3239807 RepID=UPI00352563D8